MHQHRHQNSNVSRMDRKALEIALLVACERLSLEHVKWCICCNAPPHSSHRTAFTALHRVHLIPLHSSNRTAFIEVHSFRCIAPHSLHSAAFIFLPHYFFHRIHAFHRTYCIPPQSNFPPPVFLPPHSCIPPHVLIPLYLFIPLHSLHSTTSIYCREKRAQQAVRESLLG